MESEKIKEIKKGLEEYIRQYSNFKGAELCKEALTLINELESENERLILQYERVKADSEMNCLELKDRIAELENTDYYKKIEKKKRRFTL